MKARTRVILEEAIEEGIAHGLRRIDKYECVNEDRAVPLTDEIWLAIDARFSFDDEPE